MRISQISVLLALFFTVFCATARGADCKKLLDSLPRPIDLVDDVERKMNTFHIYVKKVWYTLTPQQKRDFTAFQACGVQAAIPGSQVEVKDANTKRKLTSYGPQGFTSYEK